MRRGPTTRRPGPPTTARDQGRVSVFLAVAFTGLVMVFGVAVDATGQLRTLVRAEHLAAEAARAAGQAIDVDAVAEHGERRVDPARAADFADRYLAAAGHTAPHLSYEIGVTDDGDAIEITVHLTYQNRVLSLFGRPDIEVTGRSTAVLVTGP